MVKNSNESSTRIFKLVDSLNFTIVQALQGCELLIKNFVEVIIIVGKDMKTNPRTS